MNIIIYKYHWYKYSIYSYGHKKYSYLFDYAYFQRYHIDSFRFYNHPIFNKFIFLLHKININNISDVSYSDIDHYNRNLSCIRIYYKRINIIDYIYIDININIITYKPLSIQKYYTLEGIYFIFD